MHRCVSYDPGSDVAMTALLVYDATLTIEAEVSAFWYRKSGSQVLVLLHFLNRHVQIMRFVLEIALFSPVEDKVSLVHCYICHTYSTSMRVCAFFLLS